jgi:HlyD family secretion protein
MSQFFKKNGTLLVILLVVAIAASVYFVNRNRNSSAATQYQTAKIERGNVTATIGATGTVRAKQTAVLIWQAAGTVDNINVNVGDPVKADDVLASLKKTSLPQSVIMAEADLVSAKKALEELQNSDTARAQSVITLRAAQEAYDKAADWREELNGKITIRLVTYKKIAGRTVPLVEEREDYADAETIKEADEDLALAKAKLDDAQREFDRLKDGPDAVDLVSAQARVDAAQATLNLARVIAPFTGTVTESYILPGDQVGAGATAFRVDDVTHLYVDVAVSEVDINSVSVGQPVTLTFDAILEKDVPYNGKVVEVAQAGSSVQGVVSFTVTVELTDADELVKPGMTAAVNIVVKEIKDELLVPNRAVRLSDNKRVVYLLVDGQAVKTEIRLGSSSDTMSVIAGGDIKEGDLIILNPPTEFMGPGGGGPPGGGFGG